MKDARLKNHLTMKQVADALSISESYYSMIENGDRQKTLDLSTAKKLSEIFKMPIQEIISWEIISCESG